jgi:DNA polymerase II large subunit
MDIREYQAQLEECTKHVYEIAEAARAKGFDPELRVEIPPTKDLAARVEGLVGPANIAARIRELLNNNAREKTALVIIDEIMDGKFGEYRSKDELAEQCIRTAVTLLTEGVTVAGTEGISKVSVNANEDGTNYLAIYFASPIRAAGGTAAALPVILCDYVQKKLGLQNYRPTDTEVERYVEEIDIYQNTIGARQYKMSDDEIRFIIRSCPVCVNGEPTEDVEVSIYKNVPRVETNRVRGGMCLVIAEGITLKAAKLLKFSKKYNIGWDWLEGLVKVAKKSAAGDEKVKPLDKYLDDIVGGRPIFAYPSMPGGFRLRYGHARNSGIAAKCIHPATMIVLDSFPAVGTQFKVERPGKGAAITPCDTIEPPVVRLKNGDVVIVDNEAKAGAVLPEIEEILSLGDMLITYGDFLKANHPLLPSAWCEEWWAQLAEEKGLKGDSYAVGPEKAVEISLKHKIPLHPKHTYFYGDISKEELVKLVKWLAKGKQEKVGGLGQTVTRLVVPMSEQKRILEVLCLPHRVIGGDIIIENAFAVINTLNLPKSAEKIDELAAQKQTALEIINAISPFPVMNKAPTWIGARMGRPEKAKERLMSPPPHSITPVGNAGGKTRSIVKAAEKGEVSIEVPNLICPNCKTLVFGYKCRKCGERAVLQRACIKCGRVVQEKVCGCGGTTLPYYKAVVNLKEELDAALKRVGETSPSPKLKGVLGTSNAERYFELLEKGILRAKNSVFVFKDGTLRYDSTDCPLTHFKPREISVGVAKLRELGYDKDHLGKPLESEEQICELKPQDVLIPQVGIEYFIRMTHFLDDLLEKFYGLPRFYNVEEKEDLLGNLVIGLAPHTSAGVLGRIIGFTKARVGYAHPYFHTAKRRNADGDEDSLMLLLDALLNFSRHYLPEKRGGSMDAPLVVNIRIDPREVDDEVHAMETVFRYPPDFYDATLRMVNPQDVQVDIVQSRLGKENDSCGLGFTHDTTAIDAGATTTRYTSLETMEEKVRMQLELCEKIRAADERDVAERILNFHFLRDIYGNLRAFGQQKFRCVDCNAKYRRVPLTGVCLKCGGKLLLTVSKGGIRKYLKVSQEIAEKYGLSDYLKQRLGLLERSLADIFSEEEEEKEEKVKQPSIADYL